MIIWPLIIFSLYLGLFLNAFPWHGVAWLYDTVRPDQIEDKDDLWVKTWGTPVTENHHGGKSKKMLLQEEENEWVNAHQHTSPTSLTRGIHLVTNILTAVIVVTLYLVSTGITGKSFKNPYSLTSNLISENIFNANHFFNQG